MDKISLILQLFKEDRITEKEARILLELDLVKWYPNYTVTCSGTTDNSIKLRSNPE